MTPYFLIAASTIAASDAQIDKAWRGLTSPSMSVEDGDEQQVSSSDDITPRGVGIALALVSGIGLVVAGGLGIAAVANCSMPAGTSSCQGDRDFTVAAGVTAGVSLAILSAGIVLINVPIDKNAHVSLGPTGASVQARF